MRRRLDLVSGFTAEAIANRARATLLPQTIALSDGLTCFATVTEAGCVHAPEVVGVLEPRDLPDFKWINTVLGNLKTTRAGAIKVLKFRKYAQTYLAAFGYRFSHLFDLRELIATLIADVARTRPMPGKCVRGRHAEPRF
jgi:hypothetical protein